MWRGGGAGRVCGRALCPAALYQPRPGRRRHPLLLLPLSRLCRGRAARHRTPLWNPYIFLGVPFLANPQAAVLYPLHWPLSWLPVTRQIAWSAALHTWLLGLGGYALLRALGQVGLGRAGRGVGPGGQRLLRRADRPHQPDERRRPGCRGRCWCWSAPTTRRGGLTWSARAGWFGLLTALMVLAGHTQTLVYQPGRAGAVVRVAAGDGVARRAAWVAARDASRDGWLVYASGRRAWAR